ncbi:MAG: DUF3365 domain-containing protein [Robiginitalea sp.]
MKKQLVLFVAPFVFFACKGDGARKAQGVTEPDTQTEIGEGQLHSADAYREKGMEYAMAVQAALGKTLQRKIKEEGTQGAIEFCNLKALAITDSLSQELGANISRITDRPRNPQNRAAAEEMKFISNFRSELSTRQTPEALIVRQENRTNFYYPIVTNQLCLQCHGTRENKITPEVYSKLQELYPEDQAVGYSSDQLRGLWKVSFPEEQP